MMQERLPFLVLLRSSKAFRMIFEFFPGHQQEIPGRIFDAFFNIVAYITRHGGNNLLRFGESFFKIGLLSGNNVENSNLQNHN